MRNIDLVIPCLNEASSAPSLVRELESALTQPKAVHLKDEVKFSIIIVNDGSTDDTEAVFSKILTESGFFIRSTILSFSRNFGKEAAMLAGLDYCKGDACIFLDADLQDPPTLIHHMVAAWLDGYKVVNAVRKDRESDSLLKQLTARAFYLIFSRISHLDIEFNASDFRLLDRDVINAICECPERVRFSKGFFAWVGFEQKKIYFQRPARRAGTSKWGSWKLWNYALDGIFNFSTAPLRIWSYVGLVVSLVAFFQGAIVLYIAMFTGSNPPGYASLFLAVIFLGGLQLLGLGIVGEYVGRIYIETKSRPHYILRDVIVIALGAESGG